MEQKDGQTASTVESWTSLLVKREVEDNMERLLVPWMIGRPENYTIDAYTKNVIATGYWLDEKLMKICTDADRKTQCWKFNRMSRTYDVFEVAAECMNEALNGTVEQNRKPHRRWG